MIKFIFALLVFGLIGFGEAMADTTDYWHVFYNNKVLVKYPVWPNNPSIVIKAANVGENDTLSVMYGNINLDDVDMDHLAAKMEELLFRYPPALYSRVTFSSLQHLKQNSGGTFSLLSNTGYITGKTLRKVLALHKLDDFFDFQLYSDEAGMSKPNKEFFNVMLNHIGIANPGKSIPLADIIHIGDNPKNDIAPATALGIDSLLINSNKKTILSLIN